MAQRQLAKDASSPPRKVTRRTLCTETQLKSDICFFCDEKGRLPSEEGKQQEKGLDILHRVSTFNKDRTIRRCATEMGDKKLIAKLSEGDMISRDACYHQRCIT